MFGVKSNKVTAPFIAPVIEISECKNMVDVADSIRTGDTTSTGIIMSLVDLFADDATSKSTTAPMSTKIFAKGGLVKYLELKAIGVTVMNDAAETEEGGLMTSINGNVDNAGAYAMNLINAAKKKNITADNVSGFFATLGVTGIKGQSIANFINKVSPFYPDNIMDGAFRTLLHDSVWTEYRKSRVSSGDIIAKEIAVLLAVGAITENSEAHTNVLLSAASPWDIPLSLKIPGRLKAYTSIYLEAAGTPIPNWHQGNRAVSEMPAARVAAVKKIFRRYLALANNLESLEEVSDLGGIAMSVAGFWDI